MSHPSRAAVRKAKPGDWILIAPGDYHVRMDHYSQRHSNHPAGLIITTPGLHVRGLNRNRVVLDGTRPGSRECSSAPSRAFRQCAMPRATRPGSNGIEVYKTNGVSISQPHSPATSCPAATDSRNEIWWNGGDDSGKIGMGSWRGSYLSATSTYYNPRSQG